MGLFSKDKEKFTQSKLTPSRLRPMSESWRRKPLDFTRKDSPQRQPSAPQSSAKKEESFLSKLLSPKIVSKSPHKEVTPETFFGRKKYLERWQLREKFTKAPAKVPGSPKMFTEKEKGEMEQKQFGKEYGPYIDRRDYEKRLKELRKEEGRAKDIEEKFEIKRKIDFLKKTAGL